MGIHPGRSVSDRDRDGMPDAWPTRWFGGLLHLPDEDFNSDGHCNLEAYELGIPPVVIADLDSDGDVDLDDVSVFERCATGPAVAYEPDNLVLGCARCA